MNQSTPFLPRDETLPNKCPGYSAKQYDGNTLSIPGALRNAVYSFIAIAPKSTQARNNST